MLAGHGARPAVGVRHRDPERPLPESRRDEVRRSELDGLADNWLAEGCSRRLNPNCRHPGLALLPDSGAFAMVKVVSLRDLRANGPVGRLSNPILPGEEGWV